MGASLFDTIKPFSLTTDPTSKGKKNPRIGHVLRDTFYYIADPLSVYRIRLAQARKYVRIFQIAGACLFAGMFLLFAVMNILSVDIDDLLRSAFWQQSGNSVPLYICLSLLFAAFALYKRMRPVYTSALVESKSYTQTKKHKSTALRIDVWQTLDEESKQHIERGFLLLRKQGKAHMSAVDVLSALLTVPRISTLFVRLGVSVSMIQAKLAPLVSVEQAKEDDLYQITFHAYEQARASRLQYVGASEFVLAAILHSEHIQEVLYDLNIDKEKLLHVIGWVRLKERLRQQYTTFRKAAATRNKYGLDRAMTAVATPYLNSFSQDLTMAAVLGHLEPCVSREKELEEICRIVESGRQSILLVGDHGVGKLSIIQGLVERMIEDDVPDRIKDKRLVQLSTSALLAGTTVSGAQERLLHIVNEIRRAGNIILFINNIHDLLATSGASEGLDVSETLADVIGSGDVLVIATTTPEGYSHAIMHSEIGNVMVQVHIEEMNEGQTIDVLQAKAGLFEYKQKVFYFYDALATAASLAGRFLHEQRLPESAIELMSEAASYVHSQQGDNAFVTKNDVAHIISQKTGILATSITENESAKLLRLEEAMHERVIGQHEAVVVVANALRRARAEVRSTKRPIANFLFLGSTGVGKTELAKTIAEVYFGGEQRMIRVDMSEYQESSSMYRLIGQPGQQGTGLLTEAVRQQPFSLVLLDEMEKADPKILDLFLQVFDDGRLTDSMGRVIDFTNSIIIATSNAGTSFVQDAIRQGMSVAQMQEQLLRSELKKYFRPEFLNRFDSIVVFHPLEKDDIKKIARLMLNRVAKDLEQKGVMFQVTDPGLDALAAVGYDPEFGARPMRRAIQELVENKLADLLLSGKVQRRDVIIFEGENNLRVERGVGIR